MKIYISVQREGRFNSFSKRLFLAAGLLFKAASKALYEGASSKNLHWLA